MNLLRAFFGVTVPVPVWIPLVFAVLMLFMNWSIARQGEALRDLFRQYWRAQHGEEFPRVGSSEGRET